MQVALERERAADGTPVLQHAAAWRTLLREAHAAGLTVEALEGAPIYALKAHHAEALAVVDAVIAFSRTRDRPRRLRRPALRHRAAQPLSLALPRTARADGRPASSRSRWSRRSACAPRACASASRSPTGCRSRDEQTGEPLGVVTWEKTRQSAAYHLIDRLDYVAVMSYRDRTTGPNGVVAIASDLLAHAAVPGRARVYLGSRPRPTASASGSSPARRASGRWRRCGRAARIRTSSSRSTASGARSPTTGRGCTSGSGCPPRSASTRRRCSARCGSSPPPTARLCHRRPTRRPARPRRRCRSRSARSTSQATGGGSSPRRSPARTGCAGPASGGWASPRRPSPSATRRPGDLLREIAAAGPLVAGQPAFAGFALHDYEHLRPFLERRD